jgi:Ca-activated chloride channel homolog
VRVSLLFGVAFALLAARAQAGWSSLWYRPDQQGEQALQAGDSKRAAELFTDPRRQAYAELRAQQYAAAAKRLAPLGDAESQYNRGNALARGGDLKAALGAYDAALKHADLDPALHRDAQHNRELVAQQLKAQEKPSGKSGDKDENKDSKDDKHDKDSRDDKNDQDNKSQDSQAQAASNSSGSTAARQPESSGSQSQKEHAQSKRGGGEDSNPSASAQGNPRKTPQQATNNEKSGDGAKPGEPKEDGQSASQEEAALASTAQSHADGRGKDDASRKLSQNARQTPAVSGKPAGEAQLPQSEQQLALEQWLRQIPDDPSGLLRRKFLVEHMMKQQQVQP